MQTWRPRNKENMIEFRQRKYTRQDLMPDAINHLKKAGVPFKTITPEKAEEASKVNSKSMVLVSFCKNESGYYEIQVKDKEFYRYTQKLLGDHCSMRITNADPKTRVVVAEDDHVGKVLNVIELLAWHYDLSVVKEK